MEKEKFKRLYAGLTGGTGGFAATETLYAVENQAGFLIGLAVAAVVGLTVAVIMAVVLPRKCGEIRKRPPAEEE